MAKTNSTHAEPSEFAQAAGIAPRLIELPADPPDPTTIREHVARECVMRADQLNRTGRTGDADTRAFLAGAHAALCASGLGDDWNGSPVAGLILRTQHGGLDAVRALVVAADERAAGPASAVRLSDAMQRVLEPASTDRTLGAGDD